MKVVAQRGFGYLMVETRTVDGVTWGRIFNQARNEMGQETPVQSMLRYGYWTAYTGPAIDETVLEGARMMNTAPRRGAQ